MRKLIALFKLGVFLSLSMCIYAAWRVADLFAPKKVTLRQKALRMWSQLFAKMSGMRLKIVGKPPAAPFFLVCNHLTYVDVAALRLCVNGIFVAKREVKDWPVAGRVISDMGVIFIDRTNRRDIPRAGSEIIERLEQGEGVIVFAEGKISDGSSVLPFNSSFMEFAARSNVPVSAAAITYEAHGKPGAARHSVVWYDDISFLEHLRRLFALKGFTATVSFAAEPIADPDRKQLAKRLHEAVTERFVPVK